MCERFFKKKVRVLEGGRERGRDRERERERERARARVEGMFVRESAKRYLTRERESGERERKDTDSAI